MTDVDERLDRLYKSVKTPELFDMDANGFSARMLNLDFNGDIKITKVTFTDLIKDDLSDKGQTMKEYRKKNVQPMRPYIEGEDLFDVSVSPEDTPEVGGMIAHNPNNPKDQWYIAAAFFKENYEEV